MSSSPDAVVFVSMVSDPAITFSPNVSLLLISITEIVTVSVGVVVGVGVGASVVVGALVVSKLVVVGDRVVVGVGWMYVITCNVGVNVIPSLATANESEITLVDALNVLLGAGHCISVLLMYIAATVVDTLPYVYLHVALTVKDVPIIGIVLPVVIVAFATI